MHSKDHFRLKRASTSAGGVGGPVQVPDAAAHGRRVCHGQVRPGPTPRYHRLSQVPEILGSSEGQCRLPSRAGPAFFESSFPCPALDAYPQWFLAFPESGWPLVSFLSSVDNSLHQPHPCSPCVRVVQTLPTSPVYRGPSSSFGAASADIIIIIRTCPPVLTLLISGQLRGRDTQRVTSSGAEHGY